MAVELGQTWLRGPTWARWRGHPPGRHGPSLVGASCLLSTSPEASRVLLGPEKFVKNWHRVWTFLDIDFL